MTPENGKRTIRIGGASGFWGDAALATAQLLATEPPDFIVYDYLAEITMAIMARMRARDAQAGFATDFVTAAMAPNLDRIASHGVRVIANAGGTNPEACAQALRVLVAGHGLALGVATVTGDDLMEARDALAGEGIAEMFSNAPFPPADAVMSINAYLGAFAIARALDRGADIVVTGRCVDSAVTLGACVHAFGWTAEDFDRLAAGSLAGHVIECGTQATGGNFTDWEEVADTLADAGYPIVEMEENGAFTVTKPPGTGGVVSRATVSEQIVYEIGDPQAYLLPDVRCDFSAVTATQTGPDRVRVTGAKGHGRPDRLKVCLTWQDGFRGGHLFTFYGLKAEQKAERFAAMALERARRVLRAQNAPDFTETSVEVLGAESQFGAARRSGPAREVVVKIAVRHPEARGVAVFLREATGLGLTAPPGLSGFAGTRPRPSPVLALFSFLIPRDRVTARITDDDGSEEIPPRPGVAARPLPVPPPPEPPPLDGPICRVPLVRLAWARSGDKGDSANIGVIARDPAFLPHIWASLDEDRIAAVFAHFLRGEVRRYPMPGLGAMNIVMTRVLGGGGTSSLRNDPQAKGYAQLLLAEEIALPETLAKPS